MRTIILIVAVFILFFVLKNFYKNSPQKFEQFLKQFGLVLFVCVLVFMLATGRMHWLFGLVAAAVPFVKRMLPLLRYVPLLKGLYARYHTNKVNSAGPTAGQASSVQASYIRMSLDHDSGEMNGEVLKGMHQGAFLNDLSLEQLLELFQHWQNDQESIALLIAYMDRMHPDWQTHAAEGVGQGHTASMDNGQMTRDEASQILGLQQDATEEDIITAHRRLMQKLHPDLGGSTYLAAKINLAKEFLLRKES